MRDNRSWMLVLLLSKKGILLIWLCLFWLTPKLALGWAPRGSPGRGGKGKRLAVGSPCWDAPRMGARRLGRLAPALTEPLAWSGPETDAPHLSQGGQHASYAPHGAQPVQTGARKGRVQGAARRKKGD